MPFHYEIVCLPGISLRTAAHVQELLRQQQFLEIFLEGTRSRSGKASYARAGLLSVVVDGLYSQAAPDVLIIPVGISYDRIIEGHYNSEQLGKPKKNESLWSVARGVFRMLRKNYGCVRVDFAQPFSLKEYLDALCRETCTYPPFFGANSITSCTTFKAHCVVEEGIEATIPDSRDLTPEPSRRQLIANSWLST
uniref:Uncharacterized protein n=1 Tax=Sphaerodactylus townsendi TaxID=933632 RepID=A0ACB8F9W8_9SAUR